MFQRDKTKNFYKFIETQKSDFLNKTIKDMGFDKTKIKSFYKIKNIFNSSSSINFNSFQEIVASDDKNINEKIYNNDLFVDLVKAYFLVLDSKNKINKDSFSLHIRYMQENLKKMQNCKIGIFIWKKTIYAITKTSFNGIETFVEVFKNDNFLN